LTASKGPTPQAQVRLHLLTSVYADDDDLCLLEVINAGYDNSWVYIVRLRIELGSTKRMLRNDPITAIASGLLLLAA